MSNHMLLYEAKGLTSIIYSFTIGNKECGYGDGSFNLRGSTILEEIIDEVNDMIQIV